MQQPDAKMLREQMLGRLVRVCVFVCACACVYVCMRASMHVCMCENTWCMCVSPERVHLQLLCSPGQHIDRDET